jgi:anti-sigma regulatory factor (Ser/Thr protein kinase)
MATTMMPAQRIRTELVAQVRTIIRERLGTTVSDEVVDTAVLLADEMATNALVHAGGSFSLSVAVHDGRLRVEVGDASVNLPVLLPPDPDRVGGRGMAIVSSLASSWGTEINSDGKVVWFEIDLP